MPLAVASGSDGSFVHYCTKGELLLALMADQRPLLRTALVGGIRLTLGRDEQLRLRKNVSVGRSDRAVLSEVARGA